MKRLNKGYFGVNYPVAGAAGFGAMAVGMIVAEITGAQPTDIFPFAVLALGAAGLVMYHVPCRFVTDDTGFNIYVLFRSYRYEYADVRNIRLGSIGAKGGTIHELVIETRSSGGRLFREFTRSSNESQLQELCDHVSFVQEKARRSGQVPKYEPLTSGSYVGINTTALLLIFGGMYGMSGAITFFSFIMGKIINFMILSTILFTLTAALLLYVGGGFRCSWSADDSGFTIKQGIFTKRFLYSEVSRADINVDKMDIRFRNGGTGYYTRAVLTVMDTRGKAMSFSERSGVDYHRFINAPIDINKPQLVLLYDNISARGPWAPGL